MVNVVVTGGAGFIGSNLALRLRGDGHSVKIYDNLCRGVSPIFHGKKEFQIIKADILDFEALCREFKGAEYVFHNAAIRSIPLSIKEPISTSDVNIMGSLNVLEAARKSGIKKVIIASSSSVYGDSNALPLKESGASDPLSFYALAKSVNESHAKLYYQLYGLETVCLRYFNVFGPAQDPQYEFSPVIPKFITTMMSGERPVINGDGTQSRDFTFVDNVVNANVLAMNAKRNASGLAFNVGQGERTSLNSIVSMINSVLGKDISPTYVEKRTGDVAHTQADLSLSEKVLGYRPKFSFQEGLKETIKWYRANQE